MGVDMNLRKIAPAEVTSEKSPSSEEGSTVRVVHCEPKDAYDDLRTGTGGNGRGLLKTIPAVLGTGAYRACSGRIDSHETVANADIGATTTCRSAGTSIEGDPSERLVRAT